MKKSCKKAITMILIVCVSLAVVCAAGVFGINYYVVSSVSDKIISKDDACKLSDVDCILVLGAGVRNGKATAILENRIDLGEELYKDHAAPKIIMSGDHGSKGYDEVNVMKDMAVEKGIPSEDIFMDHAGFSTYDSIYRAKEIFEAKKIIIVTQEYHLSRALYIAKKLGVEAYGVSAELDGYRHQNVRELREILARDKDFVKCLIKPEAEILGEAIPISGNGDITDDR